MPGLLHVPGGREAYAHLIEAHTSLPLTAEEIHAIGLEDVARIDAETRRPRRARPGDQRPRRDPPPAAIRSRDALRDARGGPRDGGRVARPRERRGPRWFGILPKAPCVVITMPEHEERHSTIAYYRQPAMDGSRPGQYAINTSEPTTRPRYEAQALAYHEAVPGHHLQLAISQELTDLPDFRRHNGPTAYIEGWGLYTERLADEMGLYSGDLDRIGVLSFDAWRACRLVVDTGMHALGWTRQQAIDYMLEHTVLAENNVVNEIDRYIAIPAQALAYKIGQREILRLRAEAAGAAGRRLRHPRLPRRRPGPWRGRPRDAGRDRPRLVATERRRGASAGRRIARSGLGHRPDALEVPMAIRPAGPLTKASIRATSSGSAPAVSGPSPAPRRHRAPARRWPPRLSPRGASPCPAAWPRSGRTP